MSKQIVKIARHAGEHDKSSTKYTHVLLYASHSIYISNLDFSIFYLMIYYYLNSSFYALFSQESSTNAKMTFGFNTNILI